MNKYYIISIFMLFLIGCSVSIDSLKGDFGNKKYIKPLVVIPYGQYTGVTNENLLFRLEDIAKLREQEMNFELFQPEEQKLSLNNDGASSEIDEIMNKAVENSHDLILFIITKDVKMYNMSVSSISYQVTGFDPGLQKEVWKANVSSTNGAQFNVSSRKIAEAIYNKLVADGLLK